MGTSVRLAAAAASLVVAAGCWSGTATATASTATTATAAGQPNWASAGSATIHPGVKVTMAGVSCRAGFIFTDGTRAYIALPASCSGAGAVDNSKCDAGQDPYGLPVTITGAKHKGTLVYSSITTMELRGQKATNRCANNNLSLVRIDRRDIKRTNPSVPMLGGPAGVSKDQPAAPDQLSLYVAAPTNAQALSTTAGGWSHSMMVDGPVADADIGAPVLTGNGRAIGMVSGVPTSEGQTLVSDLFREIRYMHTVDKFADVHLAKGTVKFSPALPLLGSA